MKRAVFFTVFLLMICSGTAVVGHDSPEDQPSIMSSGSSASSTTAVSPNGTEYTAEVQMRGRDPNVTEDALADVSTESGLIEFKGKIQAATPCRTLTHEVEKSGEEDYVLNVKTDDSDSGGFCTQQAMMIDYDGSFERNASSYSLTVKHDGSEVRKIDYPGTGSEEVSGPIAGFFDWFQNLI